jgi:hypothetical protein
MTTIAVFGSSATEPGSADWEDAHLIGRAIAERGWTVATGGYGGTMEGVSEGAAAVGGDVIGETAPGVFPTRSGANRHVGTEIVCQTISHRIARLVESSNGAIALPGSIGTLAELIVAWNAAFVAPLRGVHPIPVVAVGPTWASLVGTITSTLPTGAGSVRLVPDAVDAVQAIQSMITDATGAER